MNFELVEDYEIHDFEELNCPLVGMGKVQDQLEETPT